VCTSIIVAAELRYGATKRGSPRLANRLDGFCLWLKKNPFTRQRNELCAEVGDGMKG
jgi:hypothetical protein